VRVPGYTSTRANQEQHNLSWLFIALGLQSTMPEFQKLAKLITPLLYRSVLTRRDHPFLSQPGLRLSLSGTPTYHFPFPLLSIHCSIRIWFLGIVVNFFSPFPPSYFLEFWQGGPSRPRCPFVSLYFFFFLPTKDTCPHVGRLSLSMNFED